MKAHVQPLLILFHGRASAGALVLTVVVTLHALGGPLDAAPTTNQILPSGDRFEVESTSICQLNNGDLAVTWLEGDLDQSDWLRIYSPAGLPRGDPILVFQDEDDSPRVGPALCCRPGGGLTVVWSVPADAFSTNALESRSFDNVGAPISSVVSVTGESPLNVPQSVACYDNGFLAHWYRDTREISDKYHYLVRRFGSNGLPVGSEFRVDEPESSSEPASELAARPDGSFVVAWAGPGEGHITAQGYDTSNLETGPELAVRTLGGSEIFAGIDVAINNAGTRMFVWTEDEFFFSQPHVMGRAFDSAGHPVTDAFSVDGDQPGQYSGNEVEVAGWGNFVIAWGNVQSDSLAAQTFSPMGRRLDPGAIVATDALFSGSRFPLTLTQQLGGRMVLGYVGERESDGHSVPFAQYLKESLIFVDGFESGDTTVWSRPVP